MNRQLIQLLSMDEFQLWPSIFLFLKYEYNNDVTRGLLGPSNEKWSRGCPWVKFPTLLAQKAPYII